MTPKIIIVRIGYSNSILLLNGVNSVLIDTGVKGNLQQFKALFNKHNLKPTDIKLIILTHTHNDHTGNLLELVKLTGAKVLVHKNEYENLKNGFIRIPNGQSFRTRFITLLGRLIAAKKISPKPFTADLINENEFVIDEFGIDGKVISTPGHTKGSQSVLIGKKLISGDTFINLPNGTIFPHFAEHPKILLQTWQRLFDLGIEEIYPGHGKKFKVEKAFVEFGRWSGKLVSV